MKYSKKKKLVNKIGIPVGILLILFGIAFFVMTVIANDGRPDLMAAAVCLVFIGIGVFELLKGLDVFSKKSTENAQLSVGPDDIYLDDMPCATKEYTFYVCGKMNQSFAMKDGAGEVVYRGNLIKFSPVSACEYEFINLRTGRRETHMIGKTNTTRYGGDLSLTTDSFFRFDGINIYDYLEARGYGISMTALNLLHPEYSLNKNGVPVATYKMGVIEEKEDDVMAIGSKQMSTKVTADSGNLDLIFLAGITVNNTGHSVTKGI